MNNLHNINIERSVLSSILFNPATFEEVAAVVSAKDFYLPSHRYIFEAMEISNKELKRTNINKILNAFNGQSRII